MWRGALVALLLSSVTAGAIELEQVRRPTRHFRVANPAILSPMEAETVYRRILEDLLRGYAAARLDMVAGYTRWRRYNRAPYRSAMHGERYVNNYANARAHAYGRLKGGAAMPPGAVITKDSFTVTADGGVFPGPLFVMEKLEPGRAPATSDWRYVMVMPDGSIFGDTLGSNPEGVEFCAACHGLQRTTDGLYFVPPAYRERPLLELEPGGAAD